MYLLLKKNFCEKKTKKKTKKKKQQKTHTKKTHKKQQTTIQPARTEEILKDLVAIAIRGITLFINFEQSFGPPTY